MYRDLANSWSFIRPCQAHLVTIHRQCYVVTTTVKDSFISFATGATQIEYLYSRHRSVCLHTTHNHVLGHSPNRNPSGSAPSQSSSDPRHPQPSGVYCSTGQRRQPRATQCLAVLHLCRPRRGRTSGLERHETQRSKSQTLSSVPRAIYRSRKRSVGMPSQACLLSRRELR